MGLIKCKKCGHDISNKAIRCSNCFTSTKTPRFGHCKTCNTELDLDDRFYPSRQTVVVDGTTMPSFGMPRPCPKCGDPNPLELFSETNLGVFINLVLGLVIALVFCIGLGWLMIGLLKH